jgi:hypothetical protein
MTPHKDRLSQPIMSVHTSQFINCATTSLVAQGGGLWSEKIFVLRDSPRL